MSLSIKNHLIEGAEFFMSPNQSDRSENIDLVVIHCISLPEGSFDNDNPKKLFLNELDLVNDSSFKSLEGLKVSAHILIERNGSLVQFVAFNKCAWHAGESTYEGRDSCNEFSIGIELKGSVKKEFTNEQYCALNELLALLKKEYGDMDVVGHSEIAPNRKNDPGPYFKWDLINA
ncbi:MAG: 1,6-anhydro-N-acetylmuramyl-L-alanine amidase AmpD [Gammaproteobacteria bacterium TMED112]|nr:MAG: 1,6-anhydro-N-acetylmuramyl-L-alanine amidase AmpD [Gammaproteobacteria bacterium TMED112]|tara:strand:- start:6430 stop:6954 length:525 start_codon:yes stop_codon:yes gene_type:complete